MTYFLCVQSTYTSIEIALCDEQARALAFVSEDKIRASKNIIPLIAYTLARVGITLEQLSFIAVNQGPGPFTTLRVGIATANGLSFASKIPLIGIDALDAFLYEHGPRSKENTLSKNTNSHITQDKKQTSGTAPITCVLFNAFNNDVYFALAQQEKLSKGYKNIDLLLTHIQHECAEISVLFLGNGTALHQQKIRDCFGPQAIIPEPLPVTTSIQKIGELALGQWQKIVRSNAPKEGLSTQLMPLYLKQALNK